MRIMIVLFHLMRVTCRPSKNINSPANCSADIFSRMKLSSLGVIIITVNKIKYDK